MPVSRANPISVWACRSSAVSEILAVPAPTIRSWERRYGIPDTPRSRGGHRRYQTGELSALRMMRDEIARGRRAADAAALVRLGTNATSPNQPFIAAFLEAAYRLDPTEPARGLGPGSRPPRPGRGGRRGAVACDAPDRAVVAERALRRRSRASRDRGVARLAQQAAASRPGAVAARRPSSSPAAHGTCTPSASRRWVSSSRTEAGSAGLLGARTPGRSLLSAVEGTPAAAVVMVSHLAVGRRAAVEAMDGLLANRSPHLLRGTPSCPRAPGRAFPAPTSARTSPRQPDDVRRPARDKPRYADALTVGYLPEGSDVPGATTAMTACGSDRARSMVPCTSPSSDSAYDDRPGDHRRPVDRPRCATACRASPSSSERIRQAAPSGSAQAIVARARRRRGWRRRAAAARRRSAAATSPGPPAAAPPRPRRRATAGRPSPARRGRRSRRRRQPLAAGPRRRAIAARVDVEVLARPPARTPRRAGRPSRRSSGGSARWTCPSRRRRRARWSPPCPCASITRERGVDDRLASLGRGHPGHGAHR